LRRRASLPLCPDTRLRINIARRLPICSMVRRDRASREMPLNLSWAKMFLTSRRYVHDYQSWRRHELPP
jgi:hypothetical protein